MKARTYARMIQGIRRQAGRCRRWWIESAFPNRLRRLRDYWLVAVRQHGGLGARRKLHLGCGSRRLEGFVNIDFRRTEATDLVLDVVSLPFADGRVERIEAYHLIEHLSAARAITALREWQRVLAPGGRLIIECPDFDQACREYLEGHVGRLADIFGAQRFEGDFHLYGYNADRLCQVLRQIGFGEVESMPARDYHCQWGPCLRVEATRRAGAESSAACARACAATVEAI